MLRCGNWGHCRRMSDGSHWKRCRRGQIKSVKRLPRLGRGEFIRLTSRLPTLGRMRRTTRLMPLCMSQKTRRLEVMRQANELAVSALVVARGITQANSWRYLLHNLGDQDLAPKRAVTDDAAAVGR